MERGDAWFVHIHLWVQCNFAVHWHIAAFFNNHFHHKELDIEWAKPEQSSFLHLYSENTHISEEHWKKAWKDSEVLSLTITHFLPCGVGRSLNLGCRNCFQILYFSVSVFTRRVKLERQIIKPLFTSIKLIKWQRVVEWAIGWTKEGQIPVTLFSISEVYTCHEERKIIYFLLQRHWFPKLMSRT